MFGKGMQSRCGRWLLASCACVLGVFLLSACGSSKEDATAKEKAKPKLAPGQVSLDETVHECLVEVGVQWAIAPRDLEFLRTAREAHDVAEIGSKYDKDDEVLIRLLASRREGPKKWMLWYSEPRSDSKSPEYIIHHPVGIEGGARSPERIYVAFAVGPDRAFRNEVRRCVDFPRGA